MRKLILLSVLLYSCGAQDTINLPEGTAQTRGLVVDTHNTGVTTGLSPLESAPDPLTTAIESGVPNGLTPSSAPNLNADPADESVSETDTDTTTDPATPPAVPLQIPFGELPDSIEVAAPYAPPGAFDEGTYEVRERFLTDQDTFSQWQAMNLSSDGEHLFIAAVDQQTPSKGTVVRMDLAGADWTDLGNSLLSRFTFGATGYDMEKTIRGVAVQPSGLVLISDVNQGVYTLDPQSEDLQHYALTLPDAGDLAAFAEGYLVVSQDQLKQLQTPFGEASVLAEFAAVGPVRALAQHPDGGAYVLSATGIYEVTSARTPRTVLSAEGVTAVEWSQIRDFALDAEGNVFVLTDTSVFWLDSRGELKKELAAGDLIAPKALIWVNGSLYIADAGQSYKDSAIFQLQ